MMTLEEAQGRLLAAILPAASETAGLAEADGRVLSVPVVAPFDLPAFDNSAMDGYAVRSAEAIAGARLQVVGTALAGRAFAGELGERQCVRIFTGSPLPVGTDAIVMQEDVLRTEDSAWIEVMDAPKPWENVRFRGEDFRRGNLVLPSGRRLTPPALALLAALGITAVSVSRRPRVVLIPNGSELVLPGRSRQADQIFESNSWMLRALFERHGAEVQVRPPPPDDLAQVRAALRDGFADADVVVTVGGASVGDHDLVRPGFVSLGGEVEFWKLALKPGKPFFFGQHAGKLLLGLPGNPVSAFVTAVLLVVPALRKLGGESEVSPKSSAGSLGEDLANADRRRHFVRVEIRGDGSVWSSGPQASHLMRGLAPADGLVDVPAGVTLPRGTPVKVIHW